METSSKNLMNGSENSKPNLALLSLEENSDAPASPNQTKKRQPRQQKNGNLNASLNVEEIFSSEKLGNEKKPRKPKLKKVSAAKIRNGLTDVLTLAIGGLTARGIDLSMRGEIQQNDKLRRDGDVLIEDAVILTENGPKLADEIAALADRNETINALFARIQGGVEIGGLVIASLAVVVPMAANHGLLPPVLKTAFRQQKAPSSDGLETGRAS